jgi:response regulator NasT
VGNTEENGCDVIDRETAVGCVLIADDEHLIAEGLASAMAGMGYSIIGPVADGESAIRTARESLPDIALLDISMPGMGGLEAARQLWEELNVPSVIVSAFADPDIVEQAASIGVFGYLVKPVDAQALRAAVEVGRNRAGSHETLEGRVDQLERSLASRRVVEQAKWRLIEQKGMSESEAHAALQREARASRRRIADVAQSILDSEG